MPAPDLIEDHLSLDRMGILAFLWIRNRRDELCLAAAFVLRGLKEFGEPTRKALIMDLWRRS